MTIMLVTYDLQQPGRNYAPVHEYLKKFTYCKHLESVWLLDTQLDAAAIRDALTLLVDANDKLFVVALTKYWASLNFGCGDWLKDSARRW